MPIIHIIKNVYVNTNDIAKIKGFSQTLLIQVTMRDGEVIERFVREEDIEYWTTDEGRQKRQEWLDARSFYKGNPANIYTREEAFDIEFKKFMDKACS